MTARTYQICNRCIMDTSDPEIKFDGLGNCNHCNSALDQAQKKWFPDKNGEKKLDDIIKKIKYEGRNKEFDCIIGLSGGVDSSYLAYLAVNKGLRPLVVHVDCGWNSEQAVKNIENVVKKLNIELHTFVVNWEDMKDLQRAFFKASLPDQDIPQDHAIFAALYNFADRNNIKYVLNGLNFATESIMPENWGYQAMDYRHLKSIHKKFGAKKIRDYPHVNFFQRYIYYTLIKRMRIINPLNYIDYRKDEVIETMKRELGWQYYGGKHYESRFTKFFQSYYLPVKFNFDKRRAHLSSLIISGQISRAEALDNMKENVYSEKEIGSDLEFVAKKLDWSPQEFRKIIDLPPKRHQDFPTNENLFKFGMKSKNYLKNIFR
ncbi:MAG: N-acetyl sugar amidotransferase [Bacteroidales bacterium]